MCGRGQASSKQHAIPTLRQSIKQRLSVERLKALAWEVEAEDCPHPEHGHATGSACGLMLLQAVQD